MSTNHKYNPAIYHRKSIRLQGYDYSLSGVYFITICTQNRQRLFGEIIAGQMLMNDTGKVAQQCWLDIPLHFPHAELNEFVIMPNHIHGIIVLHGSGIVGANNDSPNADSTKTNNHTPQMIAQPQNPSTNDSANNDAPAIRANNDSPLRNCNGTTKTIGAIVRGYKIGVTKWYRANINIHELWQRNYWEHIIRDENELFRIRSYIKNNPINWERDKLNGENGNRVLEPAAPYGEETWMI